MHWCILYLYIYIYLCCQTKLMLRILSKFKFIRIIKTHVFFENFRISIWVYCIIEFFHYQFYIVNIHINFATFRCICTLLCYAENMFWNMLIERQLYVIKQNNKQNIRVYYMCVVYVLYVLRMCYMCCMCVMCIAYARCICALLCYNENMFRNMLIERQLYVIKQNSKQNVRVYYMCVVYVLYVLRMCYMCCVCVICIAYACCICATLCYDENMFRNMLIKRQL